MGKGAEGIKKGREIGDKKGSRRRFTTIGNSRFREFEETWESTLVPALVNVLVYKGVDILN
jgi:hypothetical protein